MKAILFVFAFLVLPVNATSLGLMNVKMPIYLHGSDMDATIQIMTIPVMNASDTNEAIYSGICRNFIPPSNSSRIKPANINIAYEYGIGVSMEELKEKDIFHWIITIDVSAAKRPEGYPFTIEQVTDSVVTCVRLMTPTVPEDERKITIKVLPVKK